MGEHLDYVGGAAQCILNTGISDTDVAILLDGDTSGWPDGTYPFYIVLDASVPDKVEKCKVTSISGSNPTTLIVERGADGPSAKSHSAIDCTANVCAPALSFVDFTEHIYTERGDHDAEYARIDGTTPFTDVDGFVATPTTVGTALAEGSADTLARSDHVHTIGAGAINSAGMFAAGVVDAAAIATDAVGTAEIAADAVTASEIAALAVGTSELAADAVTAAKLADASVVPANLDTSFWKYGTYSGTTNSSGDLTVTHGAGFTPANVQITATSPFSVVAATGWHMVKSGTVGATTFDIRAMSHSSPFVLANTAITGYYLCLP